MSRPPRNDASGPYHVMNRGAAHRVSVYTGLPVIGATRDGEAVTFEPGTDGDWQTARLRVTIPPGASVTLTFEVSGTIDDPAAGYTIATREQPMAIPQATTLTVNGAPAS